MKLEVRCCCVPNKLLGWLDWPERAGEVWRFNLLSEIPKMPIEEMPIEIPNETVILTVARYQEPVTGRRYLAIKSEDVPLERLRKIPGFVENRRMPWPEF